MSIFISVFFVIAAMKFFEWSYNHYFSKKNDVSSVEKSPNNQPNNGQVEDNTVQKNQKDYSKGSLGSHIIYVVNIMTNQGIIHNRLPAGISTNLKVPLIRSKFYIQTRNYNQTIVFVK